MGRDDWYRRTSWKDDDRREFDERLSRARSRFNKAQYVRIQAYHLAEVGEVYGAIELLQRLFTEFPEPSELAMAHMQMADCLIALGRPNDALHEYRAAFNVEKEVPNVRTRAWLEFPWFVVVNGMREFYIEVRQFLKWGDGQTTFPIDEYKLATVEAFMAADEGRDTDAAKFARIALSASKRTHSGFRYHATLGLVKSQHPEVKRRLEELAR